MRSALLEHDGVLRDAIESHGGFLFSHTGDGVVAAFASPRSAVDAAVKAQPAATGLIEVAEAGHNPFARSLALHAYGLAFRDGDPARALEALRRCLVIARDSGNRWIESMMATTTSRVEAKHGDPLAALDYITFSIRNFHDAGSTTVVRGALAMLAALFDRLGRYESAATVTGFALSPFTVSILPEFNTAFAHLRNVLGDQTYESLARKGETMTTAAMVTYACDQIDQARAELEHPSAPT
jgi:tetratricopeptide (TPR) repeat protein